MDKLIALALGFAAVLVTGCAASDSVVAGFSKELQMSEYNYYPPEGSPDVENSFEVKESFDVVWDRIKKNVPDGFDIEDIDKASGLIKMSYQSDEPSKYVDCGREHSTFDFQGTFEEYNYKTAEDTSFKEVVSWEVGSEYQPGVQEVDRNSRLEGIVNVSVKPEGNTTDLRVEAEYDLGFDLKFRYKKFSSMDGDSYGKSRMVGWNKIESVVDYPAFGTGESGMETYYEGEVFERTYTCIPKGTLEARVLEMAER